MNSEAKHSISVGKKLYDDIKEYCALNGLKLNTFVETLLSRAFRLEKFGATPFEAKGDVFVLEPAKDLVSPDEEARKRLEEVVDIIGEDAYFAANKEITELASGSSAEEVKEETAKIADNIPQKNEEITPTTPQKSEDSSPTVVRKGNKKVTRLN